VAHSALHVITSRPRRRIALMLLCLVACTFQSLVAQAHFHGHPNGVTSAACTLDLSRDAGWSHSSPSDSCDPSRSTGDASCPLCQISLHGAAAALPPHDWALPQFRMGAIIPATCTPSLSITAVSFDWSSRGPPLT
jgi:hypothetical protein